MQLADCHVGIDGLGLIGGSIASALRRDGKARSVRAWDTDPETLRFAREEGLIDIATPSLEDLAKTCDLLLLAVPLGRIAEEARRAHGAPGESLKAVMDVGSAKAAVEEQLTPLFGERYLGFHPMAGGEKSGVRNASPDLFRNAACALVPGNKTSPEVLRLGRELAAALGCETLQLGPAEHDTITACTSHAPILVALAMALAAGETREAHPKLPMLAAGGFRDTTRMASNPPWLAADVWAGNRKAIGAVLDRLIEKLNHLKNMSPGEMLEMAEKAKEARETILAEGTGRWKA